MTSIVTNLKDFEDLLVIAKRHGISQFKLGEIEVVMPLPVPEPEAPTYVSTQERSIEDVNLELYNSMNQI